MKQSLNPGLFLSLLFLGALSSCAKHSPSALEPNVPESWHRLPEDREGIPSAGAPDADGDRLERLRNSVDAIFASSSRALDAAIPSGASAVNPVVLTSDGAARLPIGLPSALPSVTPSGMPSGIPSGMPEGLPSGLPSTVPSGMPSSLPSTLPTALPSGMPADWVPWHSEIFTHDLTVSAGGVLGALLLNGQATVRAYWRQPGTRPSSSSATAMAALDTLPQGSSVEITEDSSPDEILAQIVPVLRAAAKTGQIEDTPSFRERLLGSAREFQSLALAIPEADPSLGWWVSKMGLDLTVSAAGHSGMARYGGELRLRLNWRHMKRKSSTRTRRGPSLSTRQVAIRTGLEDFIMATSHDLEQAFEGFGEWGFRPYVMRIGVGVTAQGNVGIVKGEGQVLAQLYFERKAKTPATSRTVQMDQDERLEKPLWVIERKPTKAHLEFARSQGLNFQLSQEGAAEVRYQVDRAAFRKGLKKAAKIGNFFAERASRAQIGNWRIRELRTAFDTSITGDLNLVHLTGTVSAEIYLLNEGF